MSTALDEGDHRPSAVASVDGASGSEPPQRPRRRFKTFDSLIEVPAFRWYLLSMTGNWTALQMQQVARGFLAYQLTDSFTALGIVELANGLPRVFFALYGGAVADRASRRVIIQVAQAISAVMAVAIAVLLFSDQLRFEHLFLSAMVQGILNSFALPARQAMIPEIVGPQRLMNAFALNVFTLNVMRLGAPALAGALIAVVGASWVFALMGAAYVGSVIALLPIPRTNAATRAAANGDARATRRRAGLGDIKDGLVYLVRQPVLLWVLGLHGLTSILSLPYQRLLPGFVDEVLSSSDDESAVLMGFLLSVTAVGALVGSLLIASLPDRRRGLLLIGSFAVFGVTLMVFAASTMLWLSTAIVLVLGIGQAGRQSLVNILIQSNVSDIYRARVSSIMLLDDGVESLGIFGIALLAEAVGPQLALGATGLGMVVLALGLVSVGRTVRTLD